ncbi:MAG: glycosyltransferase [Acidimicrobiia bacterium]|nr:glycosyltransferase [Acidimicrobiia bacterium]
MDSTIKKRSAVMAGWLSRQDASLFISDVSVEAALLARLFGLPTVMVRQAGSRWDRPHRLAFDVASGILAPYPELLDGEDTPEDIRRKTHYSGFITAAGAPMSRRPARRWLGLDLDRPTLVIALGAGGTTFPLPRLERLPDSLPGWSVIVVGERRPAVDDAAGGRRVRRVGWVPDVMPYLSAADVVATHGGTNLVAQTASVGRPLIAVAEDRPFDEQRCRVDALRRHRLAVGLTRWPRPEEWPERLAQALEIGGSPLHSLVDPNALTRTTEWLRSLASNSPPAAA